MQKLLNFIDWFAGKSSVYAQKPHHLGRENFIAGHLTSTFIISVLYIFLLFAIKFDYATYVCVSFVLFTILFFSHFFAKAVGFFTHCFCAMAFLGFSIVTITSGGISSAQVAWFLCIRSAPIGFTGRRPVFNGPLYVSPFWLWTLRIYEAVSLSYPEEYSQLFSTIIHVGVLVYYFIVLHIYEFWRNQSMERISETADSRDRMYRIVVHIPKTLSVLIGELWSLERNFARIAVRISISSSMMSKTKR